MPTLKTVILRLVWVAGLCSSFLFVTNAQTYTFSTLPGLFGQPTGVAVDAVRNVYVADTGNDLIRRITPVGTNWVVSTLAGLAWTPGLADGANSDARFNTPYDLAVDGSSNIYVADTYNNRIRKIMPIGTNWVVSTLGGLTNNLFGLNQPSAIIIDKADNLYVAERGSDRVFKLILLGTNWVISSQAGGGRVVRTARTGPRGFFTLLVWHWIARATSMLLTLQTILFARSRRSAQIG